MSIESGEELKEYMCELLDYSVPQNKKFIDELMLKWRPPSSASSQLTLPNNVQVDFGFCCNASSHSAAFNINAVCSVVVMELKL